VRRRSSEVADQFSVAAATAKTHVGAIFSELGGRDRAATGVFVHGSDVVTPRHEG